jgi:hypothetical protein
LFPPTLHRFDARLTTRHSANPEHARANPEHGCACAISFLSFLRVFRGGPVPLRGYVWGAGSRNLSSLTLPLPIVSGRAALYLCPLFSAVLRHARGHRWGSWRRPHPALAPPGLPAPVQRISLSRGKVTCRRAAPKSMPFFKGGGWARTLSPLTLSLPFVLGLFCPFRRRTSAFIQRTLNPHGRCVRTSIIDRYRARKPA